MAPRARLKLRERGPFPRTTPLLRSRSNGARCTMNRLAATFTLAVVVATSFWGLTPREEPLLVSDPGAEPEDRAGAEPIRPLDPGAPLDTAKVALGGHALRRPAPLRRRHHASPIEDPGEPRISGATPSPGWKRIATASGCRASGSPRPRLPIPRRRGGDAGGGRPAHGPLPGRQGDRPRGRPPHRPGLEDPPRRRGGP